MKAPKAKLKPANSVSQAQAQRDQQQIEYKQLIALAARHHRQPAAHDMLPAYQQHGD